jgi:hypothetical protein
VIAPPAADPVSNAAAQTLSARQSAISVYTAATIDRSRPLRPRYRPCWPARPRDIASVLHEYQQIVQPLK